MSSLSPKDCASLCMFTFSDGRRCRTPRTAKHPRFCFYHAQKEARVRTAQKLGKDLSYFFSGNYLSACDLSTALAHLIPAVVRGNVKPRTARTVAYMAQTLLQAIHIGQHEYINAFGAGGWRKSVRNSVNGNHDYLFPPAAEPEQPEPPQSHPAHPQPQPPASNPAPSPHIFLPPTSAEFVQHVVAGLQTGEKGAGRSELVPISLDPVGDPVGRGETLRNESPQPQPQPQPAQPQVQAQAQQPAPAPPSLPAGQPIPAPPQTPSPIPTQTPPTSAHASSPTSTHAHSSLVYPDRVGATRRSPLPQASASTPQSAPNRNAYALHFDHNCRLLIDGKPF
jgi:hypothetical protein